MVRVDPLSPGVHEMLRVIRFAAARDAGPQDGHAVAVLLRASRRARPGGHPRPAPRHPRAPGERQGRRRAGHDPRLVVRLRSARHGTDAAGARLPARRERRRRRRRGKRVAEEPLGPVARGHRRRGAAPPARRRLHPAVAAPTSSSSRRVLSLASSGPCSDIVAPREWSDVAARPAMSRSIPTSLWACTSGSRAASAPEERQPRTPPASPRAVCSVRPAPSTCSATAWSCFAEPVTGPCGAIIQGCTCGIRG